MKGFFMMVHIGHAEVHETTRELDYYFDKSQPHDWCGPKVSIKSIDFKLVADVNAAGYSKSSKITFNVGVSVVAVISDQNGRIIEKKMSVKNFKERFESNAYMPGSYLIGWSEGENKIVLNDLGKSFIKGVAVQTAS